MSISHAATRPARALSANFPCFSQENPGNRDLKRVTAVRSLPWSKRAARSRSRPRRGPPAPHWGWRPRPRASRALRHSHRASRDSPWPATAGPIAPRRWSRQSPPPLAGSPAEGRSRGRRPAARSPRSPRQGPAEETKPGREHGAPAGAGGRQVDAGAGAPHALVPFGLNGRARTLTPASFYP